jgi:hypothetical protein
MLQPIIFDIHNYMSIEIEKLKDTGGSDEIDLKLDTLLFIHKLPPYNPSALERMKNSFLTKTS